MANRIVVPANYTFEVILKLDPNTGQSEMMVRNRSLKQITMWQVAGLLIAHANTTITSLLMKGDVQRIPVVEEPPASASENPPNGGDNNAT